MPGLSGAPPAAGVPVAGGSLGGGVVGAGAGEVCVGCGAGLDVRAAGGVADAEGLVDGVADGEWLGVADAEVLNTNGVGDGLWCRTCLCTVFAAGAGVCVGALPARAVVPITSPVAAPPTALRPATVSERPRAGPP